VTDEYSIGQKEGVLLYRHSDGYPEGVKETLEKFVRMIGNPIRGDCCEQAAGWLIVIGREEYAHLRTSPGMAWKVGAYEPATGIHGDIEWFYVVNVSDKTIIGYPVGDEETVADFLKRTDGKHLADLLAVTVAA
jgi:hypothetical protein